MKERLHDPILGQYMPKFIDFCSKFQNTMGRLLCARQEVSSFDQMDLFAHATASQPQIVRGIEVYVEGTPLLANRTLGNLILAVRVYLTDVVSSPGDSLQLLLPSVSSTPQPISTVQWLKLLVNRGQSRNIPICMCMGTLVIKARFARKCWLYTLLFSGYACRQDSNTVASGRP